MTAHGIDLNTEAIRAFCHKWRIRELSVFGSILKEDFGPDSDIDFLVEFDTNIYWEIEDLVRMEDELKNITGREIDLVERSAIEKSPNYIRRKNILGTAELIHAER